MIESTFLWVPPAVAITDLILNGAFDRHPDLRVGIVELSSIWVPQFLLMLDGAFDFTGRLNGRPSSSSSCARASTSAARSGSSSFSYEDPARLSRQAGDVFMACSDYPHSEGTADPLGDYAHRRYRPGVGAGPVRDERVLLLA